MSVRALGEVGFTQQSVRRYPIVLAIQNTLKWTTPKLRAPEAADRWTWLLLLAYVQLRLVRDTNFVTAVVISPWSIRRILANRGHADR